MERELGEPSGAWECWWIARQRLDENPMIDPEQTRPLLERAITLADEPRESFYSDLVRATPDQAVRDRAGDALELHFADSASAWFFIAMARVARDQEASLAALEHALEIDPDFPQALTMLAIFRVLSGEVEEAVELQERGIANTRGVAERIGLRHAFAATLERNEHADPALEQLDRILEERPDHVETLLLRGELLGRMGLARHGRSSFERALELEPENARARAGLGQ